MAAKSKKAKKQKKLKNKTAAYNTSRPRPVKEAGGNKKKSALKRFLFIFVLVIIIVVLFLFLTNRYIFKIGKIEINGNIKYTKEEILTAGGLSEGMELYSLPLKEIEQNIKDDLPYIKAVKLTQIPPSTLRINMTSEKGALGIKLGGDYYVLSENFKVLEKISAIERTDENIVAEMLSDNIIIFDTHTIKECYVGKKIQFQDEDISDFLRKVLYAVEENQIHGRIKKIDVVNKFYIKMEYDNRFDVELGSFEDIELKILTLIEMANGLPKDTKGKFERNNEKSWSFTRVQ